MSKLSDSLKALINAPFARPGPTPAPRNIKSVYESVAKEASEHHVGRPSWITLSVRARGRELDKLAANRG